MPSIEITPEQAERLEAVKAELASDVVGKYGHVRAQDAIEYLLDEHGADEATDGGAAAEATNGGTATSEADTTSDETESGADADGDADDDDMLNAMMNLLDTHDDKWGESGGDERYEVTLPDGDVEQVRTKDDVRALLFEHYR